MALLLRERRPRGCACDICICVYLNMYTHTHTHTHTCMCTLSVCVNSSHTCKNIHACARVCDECVLLCTCPLLQVQQTRLLISKLTNTSAKRSCASGKQGLTSSTLHSHKHAKQRTIARTHTYHTHTHTYIHTYIYIYMYIHSYTLTRTRMHAHGRLVTPDLGRRELFHLESE